MFADLTQDIATGRELTPQEIGAVVAGLVDEAVEAEVKAAFLMALSCRGETPGEIEGFARALRALSVEPPVDEATRARGIVDVCGTGGDGQNTFNISTTVAILVASGGVPVAKHGNRAITSRSGSADVLEALGIPVDLTPEAAATALRERGFAFFFAPRFHPAFRHIAPARRLCAAAGKRTLFNHLGPLLNPARPSAQLVGVSHPSLCEPLAKVLQGLGVSRGMVVCGSAGEGYLDEISTAGETTVAEFHQARGFAVQSFRAADLGIPLAQMEELAGGDAHENAGWVRAVLGGRERGPRRDAVSINAGAALFLSGRARSITEGTELAGHLMDSGAALAKLEELSNRGGA